MKRYCNIEAYENANPYEEIEEEKGLNLTDEEYENMCLHLADLYDEEWNAER